MSCPRSVLPAAVAGTLLAVVGLAGCDAARSATVPRLDATTGSARTSDPVGRPATAAPLASSSAASTVLNEVAALVGDRFAALERGDRAGWLDGLDRGARPSMGADAASQGAIYDRMRAMGVADLRIVSHSRSGAGAPHGSTDSSTDGTVTGPADGPAGMVRIDATYRLAGFDTAPRAFAVDVAAVMADGALRLSTWRPIDRPQPWDLDGLRVGRTDAALVLVAGPPARLAELERRAAVASARVAAVWGHSRPAVWVAPASDADAGRLLGQPGPQDGLAAVTDGPLEAGAPAGADRIIVLKSAWDALSGAGRDVVLTHELAHATVRASTTRAVPDWLSEGFAELVAYRSVPLAERELVAPALARARAGGLPRALPTDADFTSGAGRKEAAYGLSLLAARALADGHGLAGLVRFYRDAAGALAVPTSAVGDPEAAADLALRHALDTDRATVVAQWRGRVERLLR